MEQKQLTVITSYPRKGSTHGKGTVGVASYTKNTLLALKKASEDTGHPLTIKILAEQFGNRDVAYKEDGMTINRVWKRNSFFSFFRIFAEVVKNRETKLVMLELEKAMFGGMFSLVFVPLLLGALKLSGKTTIVVVHQVLADIDGIAEHIGINPNSLHSRILGFGMQLFYRLLGFTSDKIIVFESFLEDRLSIWINSEKIETIAHGVEAEKTQYTKRTARKKLGISNDEFVLLNFGFLAWYKGTDWLIEKFSEISNSLPRKTRLIVAGGANPNHKYKPHYRKYLDSITKKIPEGVVITDFVPEEDIQKYYVASDLVVLPYRVNMSSSGPLSKAYKYKKPFVVSSKMKEVFDSQDLHYTMNEYGIMPADLCFDLRPDDLLNVLKKFLQNRKFSNQMTQVSASIGKQRLFEKIGMRYQAVLESINARKHSISFRPSVVDRT